MKNNKYTILYELGQWACLKNGRVFSTCKTRKEAREQVKIYKWLDRHEEVITIGFGAFVVTLVIGLVLIFKS